MAAQDFQEPYQKEGEGVSDFIRQFEQIFQLAYDHDHMLPETRD